MPSQKIKRRPGKKIQELCMKRKALGVRYSVLNPSRFTGNLSASTAILLVYIFPFILSAFTLKQE